MLNQATNPSNSTDVVRITQSKQILNTQIYFYWSIIKNIEMQSHKLSQLSFPSNFQTRTNTLELSHSYLRSSRDSQAFPQKNTRLQPPNAQTCKVIKLIGDKENNIEEIIAEVNCVCGSKREIKGILSLLMGKIYRLRDERNALKIKLEHCEDELSKFSNKSTVGAKSTVGVNTEDTCSQRKQTVQYLFGLQRSQCMEGNSVENQLRFQKLQQLFKTEVAESLTFQRDFNQTNLLQESEVKMNLDGEEESLFELSEQESKGRKVLGEHKGNQLEHQRNGKQLKQQHKGSHLEQQRNGNQLKHFSQLLKLNQLDLNTLESYIEKMNCAKEISKYEFKRRNKDVF